MRHRITTGPGDNAKHVEHNMQAFGVIVCGTFISNSFFPKRSPMLKMNLGTQLSFGNFTGEF